MNGDYSTPPPQTGGLQDNVAGGLCYITIIPAIVFLVLAPYNRSAFVRFNAFQCIFLAVAQIVVALFRIIPFVGWIISLVLGLVLFVFWIIAMINAFQGKKFLIPVIGNFAEQTAGA